MVCFRVIGSDLTVIDGGRRRAAAAQRVRAGDRRLHLRGADDVHQRGADAARALRRRASPPTPTSAATTSTTASARSPRSTRSSATTARPSWRPKRMKTGRGILELVREKKILTEQQLARGPRSDDDDRPGPCRMIRGAAWPVAPARRVGDGRRRRRARRRAGTPHRTVWRTFAGSWSAQRSATDDSHRRRPARRHRPPVRCRSCSRREATSAAACSPKRSPSTTAERQRRPGGVDRRARRSRASATLRGEPVASRTPRSPARLPAAPGRYDGVTGDYELSWQYVVAGRTTMTSRGARSICAAGSGKAGRRD